jgi:uncharacterized membrane protein
MYAGVGMKFESLVQTATLGLATAIEAIAGGLIALAVAKVRGSGAGAGEMHAARELLGSWLSFALEFEVAADILRTAIAPSWNQIGQLAAIIVLRSALNFVLRAESAERAGLS